MVRALRDLVASVAAVPYAVAFLAAWIGASLVKPFLGTCASQTECRVCVLVEYLLSTASRSTYLIHCNTDLLLFVVK